MKTQPKRTFTKKDKLRRHWLYIAREGAVNPITGFPIKDNVATTHRTGGYTED